MAVCVRPATSSASASSRLQQALTQAAEPAEQQRACFRLLDAIMQDAARRGVAVADIKARWP